MGDGRRRIFRSSLDIRTTINLILGRCSLTNPSKKYPNVRPPPLGISLKNIHPCDKSTKVCGKPPMRLFMLGGIVYRYGGGLSPWASVRGDS
jgi:hypothetical protein